MPPDPSWPVDDKDLVHDELCFWGAWVRQQTEGQLQKHGCLKMEFALFSALFGDCLWDIMSNCQFGNVIGTAGSGWVYLTSSSGASKLSPYKISLPVWLMHLYVARNKMIQSISFTLYSLCCFIAPLPHHVFLGTQICWTLGISKVIRKRACISSLLSSALHPFLYFPSSLVVPAKSRSRGIEVCRLVDNK